MKKIIIPVITVVAVVLLLLVFGSNKVVGEWECASYEMFNPGADLWYAQSQEFIEKFSIKLYEDGSAETYAFGNSNMGEYSINKDTVSIEILGNVSKYLLTKNKMELVGHPRAKIVYIRISNKIGA